MSLKLINVPVLKRSFDRKVSPKSKWERGAKRWKAVVGNSFGLPAGDSCPGKTEWCYGPEGVCYADKLQNAWTSVDRLVRHNLALLEACGSNVGAMVDLLKPMVAETDWKGEAKVWRWHWDGDIFSRAYAAAITETCNLTPDVQHYLYTRSFFAVDLLRAENLVVYLSVDNYNLREAQECLLNNPWVMIAANADTWAETEVLMRTLRGRNAPACPELRGRIPLVTEAGIGACIKCQVCVYGKMDIRFAVEKDKGEIRSSTIVNPTHDGI